MTALMVSLRFLVAMSLLTGGLYPAVVTLAGRLAFPRAADGSLIRTPDGVAGSELIGRQFDAPGRFWGRPSATAPDPYRADASSGSNLGPSHPDLAAAIEERVARWRASDPAQTAPIPVDLVTASASGLDPHITPAGALWQVPRVARERGMAPEAVERLVRARIEPPWFGFLGGARVNVLLLNLDLDRAPPG
ncbi:MAG TPA: potassium-transporting ATPase subunit KdpC [Candidatus Eisenbacteria bacterium]